LSPTPGPVRRALDRLRDGDPILVYDADDREAEVDLLHAGDAVTPEDVRFMRNHGGGLIFAALDPRLAEALELPFLADVLDEAADEHPMAGALTADDLPYDSRSSFSIPVNHRDTFTGITDEDRARTLGALASLDMTRRRADDAAIREDFVRQFRAPGHVPLCVGARGLLDERRGHTELAVALARMADVAGVVAGCEMLAPGGALPLDEARAFADEHETVLLDGAEVEDAWRKGKARGGDIPVEA
jgi:3,4-dihydroxy 2-butanone 4-phosphate synthase